MQSCFQCQLHSLPKNSRFVSGHRFSDAVSSWKSGAPLVAGQAEYWQQALEPSAKRRPIGSAEKYSAACLYLSPAASVSPPSSSPASSEARCHPPQPSAAAEVAPPTAFSLARANASTHLLCWRLISARARRACDARSRVRTCRCPDSETHLWIRTLPPLPPPNQTRHTAHRDYGRV